MLPVEIRAGDIQHARKMLDELENISNDTDAAEVVRSALVVLAFYARLTPTLADDLAVAAAIKIANSSMFMEFVEVVQRKLKYEVISVQMSLYQKASHVGVDVKSLQRLIAKTAELITSVRKGSNEER